MDEALIFMAREYMQEIMDIESGFEALKTELALRRDFTLGGAFNLFSRSMQSKVTADELLFGLDRLDVTIAPADIDFFFRRYDSDQDGRLGFWEFSNALLPVDIRYRDDVEQRQQAYEMSLQTKDSFKRVLRRSIDMEIQVEALRVKVWSSLAQLAPLKTIFDQIDSMQRGFITKSDLKRLIDKYSQHVSSVTSLQRSHPDSVEMEAFVRRFNKDKQNGRISLQEWLEELTPMKAEL